MTTFCGWDGGGSTTKVCVTDGGGNVIAQNAFGPLNLNGAARETVEKTVKDCVGFMASQPGGLSACRGLTVGFAGVSNPDAARLTEQTVRDNGYTNGLWLTGDCEIALAGAIDGPGAILIAGTGSVCCGRDAAGRTFRSGGFGCLIDDAGSGYAIGRDILTAAARACDGRGPETSLKDAVFRYLNINRPEDLIARLYAPGTGKAQVAALAPLLLPALEENDAAAISIEQKAVRDLTELAAAAWNKGGLTSGQLALMGGVLTHFVRIRTQLTACLERALPLARIIEPLHSASYGAARLARETFL